MGTTPDPSDRCQLSWDYYGPNSAGTALHFKSHLEIWLKQHQFEDESLVLLEVHTTTHAAVHCQIGMVSGEVVYRILKAHRAVHIEEPN